MDRRQRKVIDEVAQLVVFEIHEFVRICQTHWSAGIFYWRRWYGASESSTKGNEEVAEQTILIRAVCDIQSLGIPCEESSEWNRPSLIEPVDCGSCIIHIGGLLRSVEILLQVDSLPVELSWPKDASDLTGDIVESSASFEGQAYNILDELELSFAVICVFTVLGVFALNLSLKFLAH